MQIVVVGPAQMRPEFEQKFTFSHQYIFLPDYAALPDYLTEAEVVFDFFLADNPAKLMLYQAQPGVVVFCQAVTVSLLGMVRAAPTLPAGTLLGFNGWPTFLNRPYLEVTVRQTADKPVLAAICRQLGTEYLLVDDRVGMVTPRVLAMLVNEAYYTLQDNTASATNIDLAMKLGTNYPYGPLEWADKVGLAKIYKLLEALYADTRDARYKICPLLQKRYLQGLEPGV